MVNDIHLELHERNTQILCKVYDGQFHDLIVHDSNDGPLTRLQLSKQIFKDTMDSYDKAELLDTLLPYSTIDENDITYISDYRFCNEHQIQLNSVSLSIRRRFVRDVNDHFVRTISIETNPVADFSLQNIITHHRTNIWNKFLRTSRTIVDQDANNINTQLSQNEITELIKGTKLHR